MMTSLLAPMAKVMMVKEVMTKGGDGEDGDGEDGENGEDGERWRRWSPLNTRCFLFQSVCPPHVQCIP